MIAALPSIADQVRNAAACAAQARAETVRAAWSASTSARMQQANALRLAVLRCMAATSDLTTRQLYGRVCTDITATEKSVNYTVYDLRQRGWAASHIPPDRKGFRIGTGRVNSWRITSLGRAALDELDTAATQTTESTPATTGEH